MAAIRREIDRETIAATAEWLRPVDHAPADVAGVLAATATGRCVFHLGGACAVQTRLGHGAIPSACQHFPRICLTDPRGVFVTLSHYCPTAAALLFESLDAGGIVEGPPALPGGSPEGLDARDALPPSLTPRMLMDLDVYAGFEREMVSVLTTLTPPERALDVLEHRAREMHGEVSPDVTTAAGPFELFAIARAAVPAPYSWPEAVTIADDEWRRLEPAWQTFASVSGRFLAAHAFASWMAYQGNGVLAVVLSLRQALAVLRIETVRRCQDVRTGLDVATLTDAIRHTDLLLRHLVDREMLASRLSAIAAR